ncbi:MAG: hypothetical protein RIR00_909, partial [Pseudomonadota bacterium]
MSWRGATDDRRADGWSLSTFLGGLIWVCVLPL